MIKYHPEHDQLVKFVAGEADPAWSLMISAHVDMCPFCQKEVESISEELSQAQLSNDAHIAMDDSLNLMMNDIMDLSTIPQEIETRKNEFLELEGRKFELPRALRRFASKTDSWSKLVGKLWQAPVDLGEIGKGHFIFMEPGGSVPEHTHRGNELTLVINGEFQDGKRCYDTGDFILMDSSNTHTPVATHKDGCLVFSYVDEPLHFTSGLARLLNPFSHLFFR